MARTAPLSSDRVPVVQHLFEATVISEPGRESTMKVIWATAQELVPARPFSVLRSLPPLVRPVLADVEPGGVLLQARSYCNPMHLTILPSSTR